MRTSGNGSRRPEEIQAEIERTRREMDGTLSAIEQRLTPGQLVDQGLNYLRKSGGQEFVSNLGQQAKQNPLPVALVGIGLAWLMTTGKTGTLGSSSGPSLGQRASEAKARLGETAAAVRDRAAEMREQPLALGAIGLAIGALAAALTPRIRQEGPPEQKPSSSLAPEPTKKARDEERERLQEGVKPYAERAQSEPSV